MSNHIGVHDKNPLYVIANPRDEGKAISVIGKNADCFGSLSPTQPRNDAFLLGNGNLSCTHHIADKNEFV